MKFERLSKISKQVALNNVTAFLEQRQIEATPEEVEAYAHTLKYEESGMIRL